MLEFYIHRFNPIPNIRTQTFHPELDHVEDPVKREFEFESVVETEEGSTISMDVTEWLVWVKANPLKDI